MFFLVIAGFFDLWEWCARCLFHQQVCSGLQKEIRCAILCVLTIIDVNMPRIKRVLSFINFSTSECV